MKIPKYTDTLLLKGIKFAIEATNGNSDYDIGLRIGKKSMSMKR